MAGFNTGRSPRGGLRFPFIGALLGAAGLATIIGISVIPDEAPEPPRYVPPLPEVVDNSLKPHFIAISRAHSVVTYDDAPTSAQAVEEATAACEVRLANRLAAGSYVAGGGCETAIVLDNIYGPACGVIFENNIVNSVQAAIITGPNAYDVERSARDYLRSTAPDVFNNRENPRATAMRVCVERNGAVKVTDLSYELAR